MMPQMITPRYKMLMSYDIQPDTRDTHYEFVLGEFVPAVQKMGLYMIEAWHTAYGNYPIRLTGFVAEDLETLHKALGSDKFRQLEERFRDYVSNYHRKVVPFREGFQF
jgi:hypothetical protein